MAPRTYTPRPDLKPRSKEPRPMRAARLRLNLTQRAAAEIFGVNIQTWQAWEAGRRNPPPYWRDLLTLKAGKK